MYVFYLCLLSTTRILCSFYICKNTTRWNRYMTVHTFREISIRSRVSVVGLRYDYSHFPWDVEISKKHMTVYTRLIFLISINVIQHLKRKITKLIQRIIKIHHRSIEIIWNDSTHSFETRESYLYRIRNIRLFQQTTPVPRYVFRDNVWIISQKCIINIYPIIYERLYWS